MEVIHAILLIYPAFLWGSIVTLAGAQTMLLPNYINSVLQGEEVTLKCYFPDPLSLRNCQWYFTQDEGVEKNLTNGTRYTWSCSVKDRYHVLIQISFKNATFADTGKYTCETITATGKVRGELLLNVYDKPTVTVSEYNYSIGMGDNLTLHCSIDGHGSAVKGISWLKYENSQNRYLNSSTRLFWNISNPSLKIINVSLDDAGNYTCRGETEHGRRESQHISVQVFYLPVISQQDKDRTGRSSKTSVVYVVSIVGCVTFVILIALIVVVILIRRKRLKRRKDNPDSGIRSTNEQQQPSSLENISSGNAYEQLRFHQTEVLTYAHLIRQSSTHIDASTSTGDAEISHVYMNIINTNAAVQQRSSASNSNSYIQEETESENTQRKIIEELK